MKKGRFFVIFTFEIKKGPVAECLIVPLKPYLINNMEDNISFCLICE